MNGGTQVLRVVRGPDTGVAVLVLHPLVVGREGDLAMSDPRVSRRHLEVLPAAGGLLVTDLGSASGSTVRGRPIGDHEFVAAGATIEVGGSVLRVLQVASVAAPLLAEFTCGGRPLPEADELVVGRDRQQATVVVEHPTVSRRHASLRHGAKGWTVTDEDSANGTFVNGGRVLGRRDLRRGDVLTFGKCPTDVTFSVLPEAGRLRVNVGVEGQLRRYTVTIDAPRGDGRQRARQLLRLPRRRRRGRAPPLPQHGGPDPAA